MPCCLLKGWVVQDSAIKGSSRHFGTYYKVAWAQASLRFHVTDPILALPCDT